MKKTIVLFILVALTLTLGACQSNDKEKDVIKIGFLPSLTAVPYIYAIEEGYYEDYGVKVEYVPFIKAKERDETLETGGINAVSTDLVMILLNNENGIDMQFTVTTEEVFRLVSSPDYANDRTSISIKDTDNASVAISQKTVVEYLVERIESTNEINYSITPIPAVPLRYAAVSNNQANLGIMPEPFPTKLELDGGVEVWNNTDDDHYITVLGFKKDFVDEYPDLVKKFHEATNQAITDLKTKSLDDYKDYIVDYDILEAEYLDESSDKYIPMYELTNFYSPDEETVFKPVLKWMKDKDYIENDYSYEDLYFDYTK